MDNNPIENGVQQAYVEIRDSLEAILNWNFQRDTEMVAESLKELDDAISNNWDALMLAFWRGVSQDVELLSGGKYRCSACGLRDTEHRFLACDEGGWIPA